MRSVDTVSSQVRGRCYPGTDRGALSLSSNPTNTRHGDINRGNRASTVDSYRRTKTEGLLRTSDIIQTETMDRNAKMRKRDQMSSLRTRKLHRVAKIQLDGQLTSLNKHFLRESKELDRETTFIEDEVKKMEENNQATSFARDFQTPRKRPSELPVLSRPSFLGCASPSKSDLSMSGRSECMYCNDNRCHYFPCFLPITYHPFGMNEQLKSFSGLKDYDTFLSRCSKVRPPSRTSIFEEQKQLSRLTTPSGRIPVQDRERGLQEMKDRNRKLKPRDWATNYGAPLPRRILLKPVTHVSESMLKIN